MAVRLPIVFALIAAWLSISNHCALGALAAAKMQSATTGMHCHGTQPSPAKKDDGDEMPCCKVLRALAAGSAKNVSDGVVGGHQPFTYPAVAFVTPSQHILLCARPLATGPPGALTFAELILQRSILAHAPPVSLS